MNYYVLQGSRLHWSWSLVDYLCKISGYDNRHLIWGFDEESKYNKVKEGDIVYFRTNKDGRDTHGVFGRGQVMEKFEDDTNYWPEEYKGNKKFPFRIRIGEVDIYRPLEESVRKYCSSINHSLFRRSPNLFFDKLESIDIFDGNLIQETFGRGSIIQLNKKKVLELDSQLDFNPVSYPSNAENKADDMVSSFNTGKISRYFLSRGYYFPEHIISSFYAALKTKGFVILSGLSGTGKTKLALEFAEMLKASKSHLENHVFLSVRPDWRDGKPLIGYYNPLNETYEVTTLLEFIIRAKEDYEQNKEKATPFFIILDEMNLSHVEYYFSDFLSVLESGRDEAGYTREGIKLHNKYNLDIPREIKLPPNIYIIGTVNVDETTYMFSPKVLDRAFMIEFNDVDFSSYLVDYVSIDESEIRALSEEVKKDLSKGGMFVTKNRGLIKEEFNHFRKSGYLEIIEKLNKILMTYDLHFGYRVLDEILLFFRNAKESQNKKIIKFESDDEILDLAILMKVLPKFHGPRRKLERPLLNMINLSLKETIDVAARETESMRREILGKVTGQNSGREGIRYLEDILFNWRVYKQKFRFPHTARKCLRMLRQLYEIGFTSFC